MNKRFIFAQFDIDSNLNMEDQVEWSTRDAAVKVLEHDPWNVRRPTLQEFLQSFFNDTWRLLSTTSIGDGRNIRYLMVKQVIDYKNGNS